MAANKALVISQNDMRAIESLAQYYNDPIAFAYDILGSRHTDYQQEIEYSVADNSKVAWRSGHGLGKTFTASDIALWFLFTRPNARVLTTASLWRQVGILWADIGYKAKKVDLSKLNWRWPLDINKGSISISPTWFAKGVASSEPEKMEGQHSEHLLYIVDEAKLVSRDVFNSIEGALTSEDTKLFVISTPSENNEGFFYEIWRGNTSFVKFHTSAFDSPNVKYGKIIVPQLVTTEWVADRKREWGEDSPIYTAKVMGDFPEITEDTLISYNWVEKAINRNLKKQDPIEVACDVARFGADKTVIMTRWGAVARIRKKMTKKDTMQVAGAIIREMKDTHASIAKIDVLNMGAGPVDRLREQRIRVMACNNASKAIDSERFANLRAEGYWNLRTLFKDGDIDIENDGELVQELTSIKYKYNSKGQIQIESKDEIRKRIGRSPDKADTLMYLFLPKRGGDINDLELIGKSYSKDVSEW